MESVHIGARMAILECQHQFKNRPWNCTIFNDDTVFGKVLKLGTRETAFVHALSAAGVAYSVTKACSTGKLDKCGCDRSFQGAATSGGFQWAGCSDNVHYGSAFSRSFVDVAERRKKQSSAHMLMNLHNNEAGRKTIENNIRLQCKCHGVSGSCELRTCWRVMPTFRDVGLMLKEKFDGATQTKLGMVGVGQRKGLVPVNPTFKPHTVDDLVYLTVSPNYCTRDNETDTQGTHGRQCNRTSKAIDGCELLCCGRGYVTRRERRVERCQCKFHWCCQVKCKECEVFVDVSTCL